MLSVLQKSVATLSEKESADSLDSIESVGTGVMQNLGNSMYMFRYIKETITCSLMTEPFFDTIIVVATDKQLFY